MFETMFEGCHSPFAELVDRLLSPSFAVGTSHTAIYPTLPFLMVCSVRRDPDGLVFYVLSFLGCAINEQVLPVHALIYNYCTRFAHWPFSFSHTRHSLAALALVFPKAHPAALGFQRGVPLLSAAVTAARVCGENGGPLLSVQLDHGTEEDHVKAALDAGVDSVMWVTSHHIQFRFCLIVCMYLLRRMYCCHLWRK